MSKATILTVLGAFCLVAVPVHAETSANLLADGGFEEGASELEPEGALLASTHSGAISGARSLVLSTSKPYAGAGVAIHVADTDLKNSAVAHFKGSFRAEQESRATLEVCVYASYFTSEFVAKCGLASAVVGETSALNVALALDPSKPISTVGVSFRQQGEGVMRYTIDDAALTLGSYEG